MLTRVWLVTKNNVIVRKDNSKAATLELSFQQDLYETEDVPIHFTVKQTDQLDGLNSSNEYVLDGKTRHATVPVFDEVSATNL